MKRFKNFLYVFFVLLSFSCLPTRFVCAEDFDLDLGDDLSPDSLFKAIGVKNIINQNKKLEEVALRNPTVLQLDKLSLWRKTAGFRTRDPLYMIPQRRLTVDKPGLSAYFFYNMSNTLPVRPGIVLSTKAVNELIALTQPGGLLGSIDLKDMGDLLKVLPFIEKMTVQE